MSDDPKPSIEDEIRRIVREEIARLFPQHRDGMTTADLNPGITRYTTHATLGHLPVPSFADGYSSFAGYSAVIDRAARNSVMRFETPDTKRMLDAFADPGAQKRMGCTCPPGAQSSCPDVTCPWKPR